MKWLVSGVMIVCSMTSHQTIVALDLEDDNDTPSGAEAVTAPANLTDHFISTSDDDWILVTKGKCKRVTVTLLPEGGPNDIFSLELYDSRTDPPTLITAANGTSTAGIELSAAIPNNTVFAKVRGVDVFNNAPYKISFSIDSFNIPVLNAIGRLENQLKKVEKRLSAHEDKNSFLNPTQYKRKLNRLKKNVKDLENRIKMLRSRLCREP